MLIISKQVQHFDEHLNGAEEQAAEIGDISIASNEEAVPAPTMNDVTQAIKQLKNNKAAGKDGLPPELLKFGPGKLVRLVHRIIVKIWEMEQLPEEWKDGVICPIYKKGDKLDCENYRAITITNAALKSFLYYCFVDYRRSQIDLSVTTRPDSRTADQQPTKSLRCDKSSKNVVSTRSQPIIYSSTLKPLTTRSTGHSYGKSCTRTASRRS